MRVSEGGARRPDAAAGGRSRRFAEVMRRAREGAAAAPREAAAQETVARATTRRAAADGKDAGLSERRSGFREEERAAAAEARSPAAASAAEVSGAAELRAVLRALPLAIETARVREGAPLSLSLGRSLGVDLRATPAGVEVVLRPEPRLARAAEAELPALVAALRARGVAVGRAEVRARGSTPDGPSGPAHPR